MAKPPRPRRERLVTREMLFRAWCLLGVTSAILTMAVFFYTLVRAGWSPGDSVGPGSSLHHGYLQATTATFIAIVACQVGTAFASRSERASLRAIGVFSNRLLLGGIAFELAFAGAVVFVPALQRLLATAAPPLGVFLVILPFPVLVWAVDEVYRALRRRNSDRDQPSGRRKAM